MDSVLLLARIAWSLMPLVGSVEFDHEPYVSLGNRRMFRGKLRHRRREEQLFVFLKTMPDSNIGAMIVTAVRRSCYMLAMLVSGSGAVNFLQCSLDLTPILAPESRSPV
ncbi:hypothetical protein BOTCAL_0035g00130 [Botryotinia calthae]|uniref:Secreted protein n=1 Tax=Botryotinia calthae TaxID=38488 RepID=A0A4Y8DF21_9HELO|nr:hypothetical protein BOTCAL_0035g00130 [Botryotinia calthae]